MLPPGATAAQIAKFRAEWGYDDPLFVQYWRFFKRAGHGGFWDSLRHGPPLLPPIAARVAGTPPTPGAALLLGVAPAGAPRRAPAPPPGRPPGPAPHAP